MVNSSKQTQQEEKCPDLTHLWIRAIGDKKQGLISEQDMKLIHDSLWALEAKGFCQLKFGI